MWYCYNGLNLEKLSNNIKYPALLINREKLEDNHLNEYDKTNLLINRLKNENINYCKGIIVSGTYSNKVLEGYNIITSVNSVNKIYLFEELPLQNIVEEINNLIYTDHALFLGLRDSKSDSDYYKNIPKTISIIITAKSNTVNNRGVF
jgi:hypothetical protein